MLVSFQGQDLENKRHNMKAAIMDFAERVLEGNDEVFSEYLRLDKLFWRYSFGNQMLVLMQNPDTRKVSSLQRFSKLAVERWHKTVRQPRGGYSAVRPKAGSKAIWIWVPCPYQKSVDKSDGSTDVISGVFFRPGPVWAVEDLAFIDTGEDLISDPDFLPDFVPNHGEHCDEYYQKLRQFALLKRIKIEEGYIGDAAGASYMGKIVERIGSPVGKKFGVLVHEIAHEILHGKEEREKLSQSIKEGEAESVCCIVLEYFGFCQSEVSAAYLRNHGATKQTVLDSMERIYNCSKEIIEAIEGEEIKPE